MVGVRSQTSARRRSRCVVGPTSRCAPAVLGRAKSPEFLAVRAFVNWEAPA